MLNLGTIRPGRTIYVPFESFSSSTGAPITITGLAVGDIKVYKDGSTTERASTSGFTLLDTDGIDFDGITGIHGFSIDLSDNTTADFWASGSRYIIVVSTVTVDSQTMSFVAGIFSIGFDGALLNTTIATLASQTSFTLSTGPAEDNALTGMEVVINDAASAVQWSRAVISAYTGSTKTVTLAAAPTFTIAAKDNLSVIGISPLIPATAGSTITVAGGIAQADVAKWLGTAASTPTVAGVPNVNVKTWNDLATVALPLVPTTAGRTLDVAATGEAGLDFNNILSSALVTLHSLTVTGATTLSGIVTANNVSNSIVGCGITTASINSIADQVWDEILSGHVIVGSAGAALSAAGGSGDPWSTALPGAYGAGTAGYIVGTNIDALISSRMGTYTQPTGFLAATFPGGTIANTTNITAGTITTVTTVGTLTTYTGNTPQTGDAYAIVNSGVHGNAAIKGYVDDIGTAGAGLTAIPWNAAWDAEVQSECADALTAYGVSTLDAAGIRTAVGLASANLDTQLLLIYGVIDTEIGTLVTQTGAAAIRAAVGLASANLDTQLAAIVADTNELQTDWTNGGRLDLLIDAILDDTGTSGVVLAAGSVNASALAADAVAEIWTTALTESYGTDGSALTGAQLLYLVLGNVSEFAIASVTKTVKKIDGSTTAATYTLDSATTPTSITRAT